MVLDCIITAVSPRVSDLLSVVIVLVTLHEVSPKGHRQGGGNSHSQVFDSADEALFLLVG